MFLPKPITLTIIWIKLNIIDRSLQGIAPIWGLLTRCFPIIFVRASRTYSYTCIVIFLILKDAAEMVVKIDSLLGSLRWNNSLCIGHNVIDGHHKGLFDFANSLLDCDEAALLQRDGEMVLCHLIEYTQLHFLFEESVMLVAPPGVPGAHCSPLYVDWLV